ncbi:MAG: fatty acid desaturase [Longimicrobiales bacterium]|nr:fatty acid desaturase [Longimicrobiales bacterium]
MSHAKPDRERVRKFNALVAPFLGPDTRRSVVQLLTSVIPFVVLWYLAYRALDVGYWLTLLLAVPTAGFLMRMFMIQHDCGHGSFFRSRRARDWVGFWIGVLTLIPYQYWRKTHAYHHAHSGDLDFRGFGDVDTLTISEYRALPPLKRLAYRAYRHPLVLFGIGPLIHFVVKHRYPWDIPRDWTQAWRSVWLTNLALAGLVALMVAGIGWRAFLLVQLPVLAVTTSVGVWLFYVQHQFEDTYWHRHEDWDYFDAALQGSSYLVLPKPLQWITANIGIHHVHHLNARIPNYRLQECMEANPEFQRVTRITIRESWRLTRLALWDEERDRLVSFREARYVVTP